MHDRLQGWTHVPIYRVFFWGVILSANGLQSSKWLSLGYKSTTQKGNNPYGHCCLEGGAPYRLPLFLTQNYNNNNNNSNNNNNNNNNNQQQQPTTTTTTTTTRRTSKKKHYQKHCHNHHNHHHPVHHSLVLPEKQKGCR